MSANDNNNPYAPPRATVADPAAHISESGFIEFGQSRPIGDGVRWITRAVTMFFAPTWWKWVVVLAMFLVLTGCIALIPIVNLINIFIGPVLSAGIAYAADSQRRTGDFNIGDAFKGFNAFGQLVLVGLAVFMMSIIMAVCLIVFVGIEGMNSLAAADPNNPMAILGLMWKGLVVAFVLWIPVIAAVTFAPALVMLHGFTAFRAMKSSLVGFFKNILPGILCAIVLLVLFVVFVMVAVVALAMLDPRVSAFAGMIVIAPIATLLTYTIYRSIFFDESA